MPIRRPRRPTAPRCEGLETRDLMAAGLTPNDALFPQQWGLSNPATGVDIEAPRAWAISTGNASVVVADVGSTGVNLSNPDLAGRLWTNPAPDSDPSYPGSLHGWNFINGNADLSDADGHGTNVAGVIAAASNNGQGVAGVDWASPLMVLKANSLAQDAAAVRFAVDHGARVINASLAYHYTAPVTASFLQAFDPLYQAIQYADAKGVVVVAAAGNSGTSGSTSGAGQDLAATPVYPAAFRLPNMISVAAVDASGNLAGFSNYGATTVDLAAPGVSITTTGLSTQGDYIDFAAGTSFAAPFVTGVAALVAGQHPEFTAEQVVSRVVSTARPLPSLAGKTVSGGIVDAYLALKAGLPDNSAGISIAAGASAAAGGFVPDAPYVVGGSPATYPNPNQATDTSAVTGPAPQSVYLTERYDYAGFTYAIPGLTPGASYRVRLDFSENYCTSVGQRTFSVAVNGSRVLANFDIYAAAGGRFKAVARTYNATADASGVVTVAFTNTTPGNTPASPAGGAKVDALTITPGALPTTAAPNPDLAEGKAATSSSVENPGYAASSAVDGLSATRWSSGQWMQPTRVGWIAVDLGSAQPVGEVRLNWEAAYAADYLVQGSLDGTTWTTLVGVTGNASSGVKDYAGLSATARYVRVYATRTGPASGNYSLYEFNVYATSHPDLAEGKAATSSSVENPGYAASSAVDGLSATRWSSGQWMQPTRVGWIAVDLGSAQPVGEVRLNWEAAYAADYLVQGSLDGTTWTTLVGVTGNASSGVKDYAGLSATARYVRVYATRTGPASGNYSLYEFNVYA